MKGVCDVCNLVDKDSTIKEVKYCSICDANMCDICRPNLPKRAVALTILKFKQIFK